MRAESLGAFERHLVASAARPQTIATYVRIARAFLLFLGDRALETAERPDIEAFLARDRRTGTPAATSTRNVELVALRVLFRSRGAGDPTAGLALKRPDHRHPDVPTTSELGALFLAASQEEARERALVVLALLFQAGLRVHELVALDVEQVDVEAAVLLGVAGKNGTRFDVPLGPEAVILLGQWLERHPGDPGPLFPGPTPSCPRASVRSIQRLFERLRETAGLTKRLTPHSLRHATATEAIGRGVSLPDTAALMRHARIETTMIYVAIASNARRLAATRIGAAIPRSILPREDTVMKPTTEGGQDAVDAEHELCDAA